LQASLLDAETSAPAVSIETAPTARPTEPE
jgi:hypothetical protein